MCPGSTLIVVRPVPPNPCTFR